MKIHNQIHISDRAAEFIRSVACNIGSAKSDIEAELMAKTLRILSDCGDGNIYTVRSQEVLEFIMSWNAFYNDFFYCRRKSPHMKSTFNAFAWRAKIKKGTEK